jgi:hypothetical protein
VIEYTNEEVRSEDEERDIIGLTKNNVNKLRHRKERWRSMCILIFLNQHLFYRMASLDTQVRVPVWSMVQISGVGSSSNPVALLVPAVAVKLVRLPVIE